MAQLIVRNVDESLVRELKRRAGEHGISSEEEHRRILRESLEKVPGRISFKELLLQMPDVGEDALFERDRSASGRGTEQDLFED